MFIHRRYHDPGRWRARASPGPISDKPESDPGPKFISFTSVTCVQLGHSDLGSVAPLVAGWPSKLCSLAVPGGRHGNVGHPSTADGFAMPPCVRSRARGRPHGPPHTTGFTVLFRMGPSGKWRRGRVVGAVTESLRARLFVTGNAHVPIPGRARALGQVLPKRQRDASLDVVCQGKRNMTQCERQCVISCACSMHAPTCVQRPFPGWCRRTYDDAVPHRTERTLRATCHVVPRSERDVSPRAGRGRPRTACELRHGPVEVRVAKDTAAEMRVGGTV